LHLFQGDLDFPLSYLYDPRTWDDRHAPQIPAFYWLRWGGGSLEL
jgi:hypothetical protein